MSKNNILYTKELRYILTVFISLLAVAAAAGCGAGKPPRGEVATLPPSRISDLEDSLRRIADECPGRMGIALLTENGDTVTVNNADKYPMMSVFKLHQAVALLHDMDKMELSPDTVVRISRSELNAKTWSPMLKEHSGDTIDISVMNLLQYTLTQSDNNASNYLFRHFTDVTATDSFVSSVIPRESFRIGVTEDDMWRDHSRCIDNYSTPLGAAMFIYRLYTEPVISEMSQSFICRTLRECATGQDRIVAPLLGKEGVSIGHKTGSGYRENGVLMAHNDVAFVTLADGRHYSLAVFVKDFRGDEKAASEYIARVSETVRTYING